MGLGIFSIDLAAIIGSLPDFIDISAQTSLDKTEDILQEATVSSTDDVLMATALKSAVTSVISTAETVKKENAGDKNKTPVNLDDETRKEIERLIKSLQTSVIHNYRSSDIIDEAVALKTVANFPKRSFGEDSRDEKDSAGQQRKSEERKIELLREQLRKAMIKNFSV